jgi:tetraacyldisaccharide 4'-kinase
VVSIGNLAVGGRGKTPLTAAVVRMLQQAGERPAILSRGYGRQRRTREPVVVRDGTSIRADLARAGDEPLMLARQLAGVAIVVCPDRYRAGRVAEEDLGATVHVLDDGFQHLRLERDLDIVLVGREDVAHPVTLPAGRLREPLDTLLAADAIVKADEDVLVVLDGLDVPVFAMRRTGPPAPPDARPSFAVAGIADPGRFFADLRATGWNLGGTRAFRDHHAYSGRDVQGLLEEAGRAGASRIVTTEKDYVRLLPFRPFAMEVMPAALAVEPEPAEAFRAWLLDGIRTTRGEPRG